MAEQHKIYEYTGYVKVYDKIIDRHFTVRTQAPSKLKAINNIKFKIKYFYDLDNRSMVYIEENRVKEI